MWMVHSFVSAAIGGFILCAASHAWAQQKYQIQGSLIEHMIVQEHFEDPALNKARTKLHAEQRKYANTGLTDMALKRLEELTRVVPTEVPHLVRRGPFKYNRELEGGRIARAQSLIRRSAPGPFEDPHYLASLAYQAASIEMAYDLMSLQSTERDRYSKFLLGTVHDLNVDAFAQKVTTDGYTIVVLHSGLVDFFYQAAKVIVEALDPVRDVSGRTRVQAVFDPKVIQERLDSDPRAVERLYRTLEAYFFNGYPRASAFETVPEEHYPLLSLILGMAVRWAIGHEYAHGLAPQFEHVPQGVNAGRAEEYFADCNATVTTVLSAAKLDIVPPEFALGGAIFALASLDLYQKAFNTLIGREAGADAVQDIHPKPKDRAAEVINCFRQFFDVNYYPDGLFDLTLIPRPAAPEAHNFSSVQSQRAYAYANVLWTVWDPVKKRLLEDAQHKRPLHRLWRPTYKLQAPRERQP